LGPDSVLTLSIAALDEEAPLLNEKDEDEEGEESEPKEEEAEEEVQERAPEFTVELETSDGMVAARPSSDFGTILPPLKARFTKLSFLDSEAYQNAAEAVFQTISIPLAAFFVEEGFDAARLRTIRLRFDRTTDGVILISEIGFQ
jgi:hypothetical protein